VQEFREFINHRYGLKLTSWADLYQWSIAETEAFWKAIADFCGVAWRTSPGDTFYVPPAAGKMRGARWFPGAKLNFAQNLMPQPGLQEVVVSYAEGARRRFLYASELREQVAACQAALRAVGVVKGDRVCAAMANIPEAIVAMLATASLGAVWASCSPDFGEQAIVDRFGQIEPKVMFATRRYVYGGRSFDCTAKINQCVTKIRAASASSDVLRRVVWIDHIDLSPVSEPGPTESNWNAWLQVASDYIQPEALTYADCSFDDPLYILFSSGTTGAPKCIVHGVGGTLLQHKKEILLHSALGRPGVADFSARTSQNVKTRGVESKLLFFTTCGWMMWNWMVSALSCGVTIVLYEGSPVAPDATALWRIIDDEGVTAFGLSPKFISACRSAGIEPEKQFNLRSLKWILSTGAPLLPDHYHWLYEHANPAGKSGGGLHVASISGGTDIISCFMLGNPELPVNPGEIQGPGLGMAIDCWDEKGKSVHSGRGELVCTQPFVSMPVGFWNDPDGARYQKAYFSHFGETEVWRHGDFIEFTASGGIVVHGRSDATLNPGGVRIGTAEIYRVVERQTGIMDSVAVGIDRGGDGEEVILLVKMSPGHVWSESAERSLRHAIRNELSPRHVPAVILPVGDIPYTRNGKKMEIAVSTVLRGEEFANRASVGNPESLDYLVVLRKKILPGIS
jgi:acetoacetyl-CoA synthetase